MTDKLEPIHVPNQDDEDRPPAPPERTQILFLWAAATTLGLFVYNFYFQYLLAARLNNALSGPAPAGASLALFFVLIPAGVSQGALVSAAQWVLLRRYVKNIQGWIVASIVGWALFYAIDIGYLSLPQHATGAAQSISGQGGASGLLLFSMLGGLIIGLCQWVVLRGWGQPTLLWIPTVMVAQAVGVLVPQLLRSLPIAPIMGWMGNGLVLGLGMAYLLNLCWPGLLERGQAVLSG